MATIRYGRGYNTVSGIILAVIGFLALLVNNMVPAETTDRYVNMLPIFGPILLLAGIILFLYDFSMIQNENLKLYWGRALGSLFSENPPEKPILVKVIRNKQHEIEDKDPEMNQYKIN